MFTYSERYVQRLSELHKNLVYLFWEPTDKMSSFIKWPHGWYEAVYHRIVRKRNIFKYMVITDTNAIFNVKAYDIYRVRLK